MSIHKLLQQKADGEKISMTTCYDYWSAQILDESDIDCLLVGDSLAMVVHGHKDTLPASVEIMALHTEAVAKGAPSKFIVADMPFLSFRKGLRAGMENVEKLMKTGANAVKVEGADGHLDLVQHIVESGVPVMGHLGLTPQSIHQLGGFKVQARTESAAEKLLTDAQRLEASGCFSIVLECVPTQIAETVTKELSIPTIGIGAGPFTDGQVLVMQDLLGMNSQFKPKFLREYLGGRSLFLDAFNDFNRDVKSGDFPNINESYEV